jgi:hypothetical protein
LKHKKLPVFDIAGLLRWRSCQYKSDWKYVSSFWMMVSFGRWYLLDDGIFRTMASFGWWYLLDDGIFWMMVSFRWWYLLDTFDPYYLGHSKNSRSYFFLIAVKKPTNHRLFREPSNEHFNQVRFQLAQGCRRIKSKYEKHTDDDGPKQMILVHMTLWVRWTEKVLDIWKTLIPLCSIYSNKNGDWLAHNEGPRSNQCTGAPTYTTTHRNKTVNVNKIKHIFIVLVLPANSVFKH